MAAVGLGDLQERINRALEAQLCTLSIFEEKAPAQRLQSCKTCSRECCLSCAEVCHKGHELSLITTANSFACACGEGCRALGLESTKRGPGVQTPDSPSFYSESPLPSFSRNTQAPRAPLLSSVSGYYNSPLFSPRTPRASPLVDPPPLEMPPQGPAMRTFHVTLTRTLEIPADASQADITARVLKEFAEPRSPEDVELRLSSGAPFETKDLPSSVYVCLHPKTEKTKSMSGNWEDLSTTASRPRLLALAGSEYITRARSVETALDEEANDGPEGEMRRLSQILHRELAQDRRYHYRNYENVVVGMEVVVWLIKKKRARNEEEAVTLGRRLIELGFLVHVAEKHDFENKNLFYRVIDKVQGQDPEDASAAFWRSMEAMPCRDYSPPTLLLDCLLQGKLTELPRLISESSTGALLSMLPALLTVLASSPFWMWEQVLACVDAIKLKTDDNKELRQSMQFLKSSGWCTAPMFDKVASASKIRAQAMEALQNTLMRLGDEGFTDMVSMPPGCDLLHPFQEGTRCWKIKVLSVFQTNARPCLIDFLTVQETVPILDLDKKASVSGPLGESTSSFLARDMGSVTMSTSGAPVICKKGDDLRTDVGCLQVFKLFNKIWKTEGLAFGGVAVQAREYGVAPVGLNLGFIEFVIGCSSLTHIERLRDKIKSHENLVNLIASAAGAFIGSYVLGVRDRHSDNIIIHKLDGYLFHIDFGHVLGDTVAIDTGPFPITPELKAMMGPAAWPHFVSLCGRAFLALRKQFALVCNYAELMLSTVASAEKVRAFMKQVLMMETPAQAAVELIKAMIEQAPSSYKTRLKNVLHGIAVGNK